jgi:hypothetical protein
MPGLVPQTARPVLVAHRLRDSNSFTQFAEVSAGPAGLRKSYATPWNSWTLVEAMDNKLWQRFKNA